MPRKLSMEWLRIANDTFRAVVGEDLYEQPREVQFRVFLIALDAEYDARYAGEPQVNCELIAEIAVEDAALRLIKKRRG